MRRPSIRYATALNIFSVLINIGSGFLLLPVINNSFEPRQVSVFILLLSVKSCLELFTSAFGGAAIRIMVDGGTGNGYKFSRKIYCYYAAFLFPLSYIILCNIYSIEAEVFILFYLVVASNLVMQPRLQLMTSLGYQQTGPFFRISVNFLFLIFVLSYLIFFPEPVFFGIYLIQAVVYVVGFFICSFVLAKKVHLVNSGDEEPSSDFNAIAKKAITSYSLFALLMAFTFQVEPIFLVRAISPELFVALIALWKIPNIITQMIWRFCEVQGVQLKTYPLEENTKTKIRVNERRLFVACILSLILFVIFGESIFKSWMGGGVAQELDFSMYLILGAGIPILSMNRFYSSYLQFSDFSFWLAGQYLSIIAFKVAAIFLYAEAFPYLSYMVWYSMEFVFLFINRYAFYAIKKS